MSQTTSALDARDHEGAGEHSPEKAAASGFARSQPIPQFGAAHLAQSGTYAKGADS